MDILTTLLAVIIIILFPLGQIFRFAIWSSTAITPLDVGVGITAIITLSILFIQRKKFPTLYIPIGLFILTGFVGLLCNIFYLMPKDFLISFLYLVRYAIYACIGISVLLLNPKKGDLLIKPLIAGGGIVIIAGYFQYFFFPSLWSLIYEGWDPHLYRMFSTFLDPNFSGVFFVLYFLLVFHLLFQQKTIRGKIVYGLFSLLSFFAVIMSLSRGAYIVFGVAVVTYLYLKGFKKLAIGIPLIILIMAFMLSFFTPYGEGKNLFRMASTDARIVSDMSAMQIFLKNPFVGVGFDSYRYAQYRYHLLEGLQWQESHSGAGTNNSYLFVLATTGLLGGCMYGYFWFVLLRKSLRGIKEKRKHALFFFVSFIALLVSGLFENTLFYPSIMLWMWVLVGLS